MLAESRDAGLGFEEAWALAVRPGERLTFTNTPAPPHGAIRWPTDSKVRIVERAAILETKDAWRRAYERRPATRRERSVVVLAQALEDLDLAALGDRPEALVLA